MLRLIRIDASAVFFLSIFLPTFSRTGSITLSAKKAAPMLFAAICTWIANDLNDRERDRINHPDRPLASGAVTPGTAAVLFFVSLAAALVTTVHFIDASLAFWYFLVIILALSYGYVVELIPVLKAPYVAAAMAIPIVITAKSYAAEPALRYVAAAVFCFALGKETCLNLLDRPGDTPSVLHELPFPVVARMAFSVLAAGLLLLLPALRTPADSLYWLGMAILLVAAAVLWFQRERHAKAIRLVRIEWLLGLYFLW